MDRKCEKASWRRRYSAKIAVGKACMYENLEAMVHTVTGLGKGSISQRPRAAQQGGGGCEPHEVSEETQREICYMATRHLRPRSLRKRATEPPQLPHTAASGDRCSSEIGDVVRHRSRPLRGDQLEEVVEK